MLGRFFKRFTERKSDMGFDALIDLGARTAANIAVSPESALKCVPVYAGVRVRCETIGALPFMLHRRRGDGGKDRATDHPLYRLIHDRPNAWTSAAEFVMQLEQDCITDGGGYALANRSGDKIVELIRLAPRSVCVETDDASLEPKYIVTLKDGTKRPYRWQDILHVPTLGNLAPIKQAREAIGLCMAMERHAGALFGNGARPAGVLKFKRKLADDVYERLRKSWASGHSGENAGKTAILEDEGDFTPLTFNSVDLQFQELRAFQVIEIARALGVPPNLLMDFGRATWSNAEQMAQAFLTFTLLPRMKLWAGAVSRLRAHRRAFLCGQIGYEARRQARRIGRCALAFALRRVTRPDQSAFDANCAGMIERHDRACDGERFRRPLLDGRQRRHALFDLVQAIGIGIVLVDECVVFGAQGFMFGPVGVVRKGLLGEHAAETGQGAVVDIDGGLDPGPPLARDVRFRGSEFLGDQAVEQLRVQQIARAFVVEQVATDRTARRFIGI